jgi:TonB-dependent starch-binding outer membrane protein SusC
MRITVSKNSPQPSTSPGLLMRRFKKIVLLALLSVLLVFSAQAQNGILVKGRITDDKKLPLASASVVVKGTNAGTNTNENGEFQINAPANGRLVISSVGFEPLEVGVGAKPA